MTSLICSWSASASHCAAVCPRLVSMRMSSGPSRMNENPRSASSIWGEDTPRSSSTPSTRSMPRRSSCASSVAKPSWAISTRPSAARRAWASAMAAGSLSNTSSRAPGASRLSSRRLCPPRPKVPSTYTPSSGGACSAGTADRRPNAGLNNASMAGSSRTVRWEYAMCGFRKKSVQEWPDRGCPHPPCSAPPIGRDPTIRSSTPAPAA